MDIFLFTIAYIQIFPQLQISNFKAEAKVYFKKRSVNNEKLGKPWQDIRSIVWPLKMTFGELIRACKMCITYKWQKADENLAYHIQGSRHMTFINPSWIYPQQGAKYALRRSTGKKKNPTGGAWSIFKASHSILLMKEVQTQWKVWPQHYLDSVCGPAWGCSPCGRNTCRSLRGWYRNH